MAPPPAVRGPREAVALKANPELTDAEHHRALALHEAAHMVTAVALGFSPGSMWMGLDRTNLAQQGHTHVEGASAAQYAITWVSAGAVAEERAVRDMGYDESSHPQFFNNCYTFNAFGDNEMVRSMHQKWHGHPQVFVDKDRARADARLLMYNPRLWEATKALAEELQRHPGRDRGLNAQQIRQVLAPFRVESAAQERGLKVWTPAEFEAARGKKAADSVLRLDNPRGRPRPGPGKAATGSSAAGADGVGAPRSPRVPGQGSSPALRSVRGGRRRSDPPPRGGLSR